MKISANIQSYKRAGAVDTLKIIPWADTWVHKFEIDDYRDKNQGHSISELTDSLRGNLPKVKNFIMDKVFEDPEVDACLFLDDDMQSINYFQGQKRFKLEGESLNSFLIKHTLICQEWGLKLWGINVNGDSQCYREYTPFSTLSYVSSSFSCFLRGNALRYDPKFPLKEDYDMTISQCEMYRGVLRVNRAHYLKKSMENVGGCGMYRNVEKEKEQFLELQKKWGDKIVQMDSLDNSRNHKTEARRAFDINPVIRIPIGGV